MSQNTYAISDEHWVELRLACASYADSGKSLNEITREEFRLPAFEEILAHVRRDLHSGKGISILTGIDPDNLTKRERSIMFAGIASHVSTARGFQSGGKILCHVKDLSHAGRKTLPSPYSNVSLPFHTDFGDIVAMYVINAASIGGHGTFAPVSAVYNGLATIYPECLGTLSDPSWPFDRPMDNSLCDYRPLMFFNNGHPEMVFSRGSLTHTDRSHRPLTMPDLTEAQRIALDAVQICAEQVHFRHEWKKGDVLFLNNRRTLHGRGAFVDKQGVPPRHMLRLWLQDRDLAGTLPSQLQKRWDHIFRGVGHLEDEERAQWPEDPCAN